MDRRTIDQEDLPTVPIELACGTDEYKLVNGSDESDPSEYGDPCILESGGNIYIALIEETDDGERVSLLGDNNFVFKGRMVKCGYTEYDEVGETLDEEEDDDGDGPIASDDSDDDAGDEPESDDSDDGDVDPDD